MRFTLTYEGPLPSKGNLAAKETIRQALRPQLAALWALPPLDSQRYLLTHDPKGGRSALVSVGDVQFAPLVCDLFKLHAELDILLLRQQPPGALITSGGDIDNKLKTLFDALRTPHNQQELGQSVAHGTSEDPYFTLLEDDRLVTRVNVESDRLLGPAQPDHVRVIIRVTTRRWLTTYGNVDLGS